MQKRLLLCLVLSIGFMFMWTQLGQKMGYYDEVQTEEATTLETENGEKPKESDTTSAPGETAKPSEAKLAEASTDPVPEPEPEEVIERQSDVLENDTLKIVFDNEGGHVRDVVLKNYYLTSDKLEQVRLVFADKLYPGTIVFDDAGTDTDWMYKVDKDGNNLVYTAQKGSVVLTKTFSLGEKFQLRSEITYKGAPSTSFMMVVSEGLQPVGPDEELTPSLLSMGAINPKMMMFAWSEEGEHESDTPGKGNRERFEPVLEEEAPIEWAGVKDNYFANVFMPDQPLRNLYSKIADVYPGPKPIALPAVALRAQGELKGSFFMGPMIKDDLAAADPRLESLITYGWAGLLSKWLLAGLELAHDLTGNWGWAIVLLTLFIRCLMIPLTIPSVKSSFKMRNLQPKITKLKEKYSGSDMETKQKLSQATFELYRKEGVNPFSSCFTALAQMPVFFAYFSLLRTSISLRQADWMVWITDLSVKDSTFILPILMGVTMFLSTLAMPMPSADPAQQKMMKIMPVMFSVMFIFMPSGLILYMITSNLFTLGQTKFLQWRYSQQ